MWTLFLSQTVALNMVSLVKHKQRQNEQFVGLNPALSRSTLHTFYCFHLKHPTERGCDTAYRVKLPFC